MNTLRNKVQLIGYLGKAPEIKVLESGNTIARFNVATNETYRNSDGDKVTETTWHTLIAWNKVAEIAQQLLKKGTEVVVEGKLINRSYEDKDGNKRYITEIQVSELLLVGSKPKDVAPSDEGNKLPFDEDEPATVATAE